MAKTDLKMEVMEVDTELIHKVKVNFEIDISHQMFLELDDVEMFICEEFRKDLARMMKPI